jgi:hypothetical protein
LQKTIPVTENPDDSAPFESAIDDDFEPGSPAAEDTARGNPELERHGDVERAAAPDRDADSTETDADGEEG